MRIDRFAVLLATAALVAVACNRNSSTANNPSATQIGGADPGSPVGGVGGVAADGGTTDANPSADLGAPPSTPPSTPPADLASGVPPNRHRFCGWVEASGYVVPEQDPSYTTFAAHADDFDAVHPVWWHLSSATTLTATYGEGSATILNGTTATGKRTLLIPTITAADGAQPGYVVQMIGDATLRAAHVATIVQLVVSKGYDGIDIDYEHLPDSARAGYSQFASDLATALHAQGKTLSFAVGPDTTDLGFWDFTALSAVADELHVMGYDYHSLGTHLGPVAPLGWIKQVVAYIQTIAGGTRTGKFILGIPNYGIAGPDSGTAGWFGSSMDAINMVSGNYVTTTDHMTVCPYRNGGPVVDPGRAPNAQSSQGHLYFDDLASMEEKVAVAAAAGLGGLTYWTIGGEPDRPGPRTFFQMVRSYFPK
jgi:spore germination protein YaaH